MALLDGQAAGSCGLRSPQAMGWPGRLASCGRFGCRGVGRSARGREAEPWLSAPWRATLTTQHGEPCASPTHCIRTLITCPTSGAAALSTGREAPRNLTARSACAACGRLPAPHTASSSRPVASRAQPAQQACRRRRRRRRRPNGCCCIIRQTPSSPPGQMHLADFLGYAAAPELRQALAALPPLPQSARHCLLTGPERSGKTSLLFHVALSLARQDRSVLLLCRRWEACRAVGLLGGRWRAAQAWGLQQTCIPDLPASAPWRISLSHLPTHGISPTHSNPRRDKLEQVPPLLPEGVPLTDPAWQRVSIKYLASGGWRLGCGTGWRAPARAVPPVAVPPCRLQRQPAVPLARHTIPPPARTSQRPLHPHCHRPRRLRSAPLCGQRALPGAASRRPAGG